MSGLGNPIGQAESQLAKAIAGKVDNDILAEALKSTNIVDMSTTSTINYEGIVDAVTKFEDEEDGVEKVMFISPLQKSCIIKRPNVLVG